MNTTLPFKHWIATLAIAPILLMGHLNDFFDYTSVEGILGTYFMSLIFSFFTSLPIFICNSLLFYFLREKHSTPLMIKFALSIATITGITITMTLIWGYLTKTIIIGYSVATIVSILLFKISNDHVEILEDTKM